jgi:Mrp family chromosome partitioning ATPase
LDAPPVMGLADAPLIAWVATGAIMAVEAGRTSRAQARAAIRRLRMANTHLLGVVLTKFDARQAAYGYGYNYAYEYDYKYGTQERGQRRPAPAPAIEPDEALRPPPAA